MEKLERAFAKAANKTTRKVAAGETKNGPARDLITIKVGTKTFQAEVVEVNDNGEPDLVHYTNAKGKGVETDTFTTVEANVTPIKKGRKTKPAV